MVKWITEEMAIEAAEEGLEEAIECSHQKWINYATCTQEELDELLKKIEIKGKKEHLVTVDGQDCALCEYRDENDDFDCGDCLASTDAGDCYCCGSLYRKLRNMLSEYKIIKTKKSFDIFQKQAEILADIIKGLGE